MSGDDRSRRSHEFSGGSWRVQSQRTLFRSIKGTSLMHPDEETNPKSKALFDPIINYGHILTAVSFILAGAGPFLACGRNWKVSMRGSQKSRARCSSLPAYSS